MEDIRRQINSLLLFGASPKSPEVQVLASLYMDSPDVADDDKIALEMELNGGISSPHSSPQDPMNIPATSRRLFPVYQFEDDSALPDGFDALGASEGMMLQHEYGRFLLDAYLPTFHPMPDQQRQHKLAACFMLINSGAVLNAKQCLPIPYAVGANGSGKSEFLQSIGQHYPESLRVEILPNNTGAGIRDILDNKFGYGDVGFAAFDNFNPKIFMERAGNFYDIILANNRQMSVSRISAKSNDDGKSEYRTYCYKAFSSVFDLEAQSAIEFGEIARRTISLRFKEAKPSKTRIAYDWSRMSAQFMYLWGESEMKNIKGGYVKHLSKMAKMNPEEVSIPAKRWTICQVPIAVGIYFGIFKDIDEGIAAFAEHLNILKTSAVSSVGSPLSIVLAKYIKEDLPRIAADSNNPFVPAHKRMNINQLPQSDVIKHVQASCGFSVGKREFQEIIGVFANFGYSYSRISGDIWGFIKE